MSVSFSRGRVSRLASSCPKDFNFEFFVYQNEALYSDPWSGKTLLTWFQSLPDATLWNCGICLAVYLGVILVTLDFTNVFGEMEDIAYNIVYGIHVLAMFYEYHRLKSETVQSTWLKKVGLLVDILSYVHYPALFVHHAIHAKIKLVCYAVRFHRPVGYLWALNDSNLKGSVLGTALKFFYLFLVLRIACTELYLNLDTIFNRNTHAFETEEQRTHDFLKFAYQISNNFMPVGSGVVPHGDFERARHLLVLLAGCLAVSGAAVASLSLVVSLYMRPEELFRARFRLIMHDLKETLIRQEVRDKVETFYNMYWHKKKAVSVAQLLPVFPPTLLAGVNTDIFFEAQQKSIILRDLSYQFLYELARVMEIKHYIPGDAIIQRNSSKSTIIYITYGDVEMLTAEDNRTPILRMTRGTILNACGGCAAVACARAPVEIRAATFCIAHVLDISQLWKVAVKHGRQNGQAFIIHSSFDEHFEKVKTHFRAREPERVRYKSSITFFKRNLIALKEARDDDGELLLGRSDYFLDIAGCYLMRNRCAASLTDESDSICLRATFPCILQPHSSLLVVWHALVAFLICIVAFTHPYNLVYLPEVSYKFKFWDYMMTLIFTLDLIVHLSTGANVEEGVPITLAQTSCQQVHNPWFVVDVLGTVPILEFVGDGKFAGLNKLLRLPKVFRVLKAMEEVCVYHSNGLRLASYSLMLLIMTYLVATVQQGYMCYFHNRCLVLNFTRPPYWSEGELDTETIWERVMYTLYWAISFITFTSHWTQLVEMDLVTPIVYNLLLVELLTMVHLFVEAVYSATIMVTTSMRDAYDQCIENVKNFLIRNHVDPTLRHRFIQYLQLCWYTDMAYAITHEKQSIYFDLPSHVYQGIVARQRSKYILCLPFMQFLHEEELKNVSSNATLFYTSPNEILLNTGDINNEVYIIKKGMCEVFDPDTKAVIHFISNKKYFGVLECLMRFPAYYTVRAVTHVQVISISRKYLDKVIRIPKVKEALDFIRLQPEYNRIRRRRELFLEFEHPPAIPNRQRFPLPRKHVGDAAYMQPFQRLGFFSVLRYIFPRFTIRPDGRYMTRYEWFRSVCALASAVFYPGYTYLVLQLSWLYYLTLFLDVTAYFDIVQRMLVGFYNEQGVLVYHPASSAANYLGGAFLVDLFASLPLENLEYDLWTDNSTRILMPPAQFLMLNRLLQLYRLPGAMDILSTWIHRRDIILVIKCLPLFLAVISVLTCLVVYHSATIYAVQGAGGDEWRIVPLSDPGGSWMVQFNRFFRYNMTSSPWNMHLSVYFWVVYETTTTGYGMFRPSSMPLLKIFFFGMLTSAMITTYVVVSIISIRANVNKELASFQEHMRDILTYMRREELDKKLQKEVLDYYAYNWEKRGGLDYRNVLKLCDQITLRTDAILYIYGHTFAKCPILFHCDMSLLRVMGRAVHSVYFQRNTHIYEKDDVIRDMYFLDYGKVEVVHDIFTAHSGVQLARGSVFGNLDAKKTYRCQTQVEAVTNIHLLKINSMTFHEIVTDFPTVKVLMKKYRPHDEAYIVGHVRGDSEPSMMSLKDRSPSSPFIHHRGGISAYLMKNKRVAETYLIVICLLCIYGDIYNAAFQDNRIPLVMTLYFLDVCFFLKILVTFTMPMMTDEDETKNNLIDARKQYLKSDFKYDIASSLPIELLSLTSSDLMWRLFSLLRLNRLLRVVTVDKCIQKHLKRLESNLTLTTVLSVSIWFTLFIHTASCLWYAIGVMEDHRSPNSSWMHISEKYKCGSMYFCSGYFVLSTFMQNGIGDILPRTHSEVVFVTLLQLTSSLMYMIYVGEFSNIIQYQSFRSFGFYSQYLELQEYLKNNHVSCSLVKLVNRYSLHLWREGRGLQVPHFLSAAPHCFKLNIMSAAYMQHFLMTPAFKDCERAFLRQLVGCVTLYTYCEGIFVVKDSEMTDCMYLIHKGTVQELDEDMDETTHGHVFTAGEHFGMLQGLVRDTPFTYSYRTKTKCQILTLHLQDWEYLLEHFPHSQYAIYKNVPGHPYSRPPQDRPPSTPKQDAKKTTAKAPSEGREDAAADDMDAVEDPWSVRRRIRRSTIFGIQLPTESNSVAELNEEKETKHEGAGRKSVFHIPTVESDVMLPDMEADENLQTVGSEPALNIESSKKSTISLSTIKSAPSGHLLPQLSQDLRPYIKGEEEHAREMSLPSIASEPDLSIEEPSRHRRKTLFQKIAESAKKFVSGEDNESKDSSLLEEQIAATNALMERFQEDEAELDTAKKSTHPRLERLTDKKAKKEEDEDENATSSRAPRLSFHPRLLQKYDENKTKNESSDLQEPVDKETDEVEYPANSRTLLSFHPIVSEEDKVTKKETDDEDAILGQKRGDADIEAEEVELEITNLTENEKRVEPGSSGYNEHEKSRKESKPEYSELTGLEQTEDRDKVHIADEHKLNKETDWSHTSQATAQTAPPDESKLPTGSLATDASSSAEVDINLWPMHKRSRKGKSSESGYSTTEIKSEPKEENLERTLSIETKPAISTLEIEKKTESSIGAAKEESKELDSPQLTSAAAPDKIAGHKSILPTGSLSTDDGPTTEVDTRIWPIHKKSRAEKSNEQDLTETKSEPEQVTLPEGETTQEQDDAKKEKESAHSDFTESTDERAAVSQEANKDESAPMTQESYSDKVTARETSKLLAIDIPKAKDEEDNDDYQLFNIHSDEDAGDFLGKKDSPAETEGITSALRTERMSRIGRVRYQESDEQEDELEASEGDERDQPSTSLATDSTKSQPDTDKRPR